MRGERRASRVTHYAKGNRFFNKEFIEFKAHCSSSRFVDGDEHTSTNSLDSINCKSCLLEYIKIKSREVEKAKEYLKYAR